MSDIIGRRYEAMRETFEEIREATVPERKLEGDIQLAEQWNPPHKPAEFSPYDVVLLLNETMLFDESRDGFEAFLKAHNIEFDRVVSFEENTHTDQPDFQIFVSLATLNEIRDDV